MFRINKYISDKHLKFLLIVVVAIFIFVQLNKYMHFNRFYEGFVQERTNDDNVDNVNDNVNDNDNEEIFSFFMTPANPQGSNNETAPNNYNPRGGKCNPRNGGNCIPRGDDNYKPSSQGNYKPSNDSANYIPKSKIPRGDEDLYILKSEIVPPVCPACPNVTACPSNKAPPPCPPCARCPEPAFDCKKVPNYNSASVNQYLPQPVLADFSQFGM